MLAHPTTNRYSRGMDITEIPILDRFVVFEGPDGAGTTTQLRTVDRALTKAAIPHWITCEPTDGAIGRLIREALAGRLQIEQGTIAHLFSSDRYEHLYGRGGILEHLDRGEVVVCDRYLFSSLAYQGSSCGIELPFALNRAFLLPGLLIFFDLQPALSMARLETRSSRDIYETLPFLERVKAGYDEALRSYASTLMKVHRLDGSLEVSQVSHSILLAIESHLGLHAGRLSEAMD